MTDRVMTSCHHCHKPGPFAVFDRNDFPIEPTCAACGCVQPIYEIRDLPAGTWLHLGEGEWQVAGFGGFDPDGAQKLVLKDVQRDLSVQLPIYLIRGPKFNRCRHCVARDTLVSNGEPEYCTSCQKVQREYTVEDLPIGTRLRSHRDPDMIGVVESQGESRGDPTVSIAWANGAYSDPWVFWVTNRKAGLPVDDKVET